MLRPQPQVLPPSPQGKPESHPIPLEISLAPAASLATQGAVAILRTPPLGSLWPPWLEALLPFCASLSSLLSLHGAGLPPALALLKMGFPLLSSRPGFPSKKKQPVLSVLGIQQVLNTISLQPSCQDSHSTENPAQPNIPLVMPFCPTVAC